MNELTQASIKAVQDGFKKISAIQAELGHLFYHKLFEMDPGLRSLFSDDIEKQGHMLMTAIQLVVDDLDDPDKVERTLAEIGRRHIGYGAMPGDFDAFGAALLWTLQQGLGPDYTPAFESGWILAFDRIRTAMKLHTGSSLNPRAA